VLWLWSPACLLYIGSLTTCLLVNIHLAASQQLLHVGLLSRTAMNGTLQAPAPRFKLASLLFTTSTVS
jgi:hypothetical protein